MNVVQFGDTEPEDAWHPDDPPIEQVANLRTRLALLVAASTPDELRDELAVISDVVQVVRRRRLSGRDEHRADQLGDDVRHVLGRLA